MDHRSGQDLFKTALANGGRRTSLGSVEWDLAGDCEAPVPVELKARPPSSDGKDAQVPKDGITMYIDLKTRCRRCGPCLRQRRNLWTARARHEIAWAPGRTWFLTLTVEPGYRAQALMAASARARKNGIADLLKETEAVQWAYLNKVTGPWVTKYLKRLRREVGSNEPDMQFRYLLVVEPHGDGFPHWHLLVHEYVGDLRKNRFGRWTYGFWKARLVKEDRAENGSRAAKYVAKYLAKAKDGRVRASLHYGAPEKSPLGQARLIASVKTTHLENTEENR